MSKKKVLMVHNFYQVGGGEHTVFKNEVEMLRENGHEVIEYTRSNDELKKSKLKLLLLPFTTIWSFKTYHEVKKVIKQQQIDVVHCHNTFPLISPSVYYAARNQKVPVVQTIHNFRFLCPCGVFFREGKICEECLKKDSFKPALRHKCYRNSKIQTLVVVMMLYVHRKIGTYKKINYIFLTEFNKQKFSKLIDINGTNVFVKPNFVQEVTPIKLNQEIKKTFVFASRLEENKGIRFLLNQWKNMPEDYHLHIYGAGTLEKFVEKEVCNKNNIKYFGFCSHDEIFEDLKTSMGMIFPSLWYEGYPMIIAESMSIGCPVVSANIGNAADIVLESKGGEVYNPNETDDFIEAIKKTINNNDELRKNALLYYKNVLAKNQNYIKQNNIYSSIPGGGIDTKNKKFAFVGRLDRGKGILELVNRWRKLPSYYELHIYGEGECKTEIRKISEQYNNIILHGFNSQKIILGELKNSIALIAPYLWYEGYPMVIAESFSVGCPVVATDNGNAGNIIAISNGGVVYKSDDNTSFYDSLEKIIIDNQFYRDNAKRYFEKELNSKRNYEGLRDIYDKCKFI